MTERRQRYLGTALGLAGGLAVALAIIAVFEPFEGDDASNRLAESSRHTAPAPSNDAREAGTAVMALHEAPRAIPELAFRDGDGQPVSLADFKGQVVLLNIWATWCGPCREEMPTLDRLQAELGGPDFQVVALSIDRAGVSVVSKFYDEIGIAHLREYIDESGAASPQLKAMGLPTTLLIDREGREIARHVGPAEWDTPEMVAFFRRQLGRESGALRPEPPGSGQHQRASDSAVLPASHGSPSSARFPVRGLAYSPTTTKGEPS